jgi:hypothetical protein
LSWEERTSKGKHNLPGFSRSAFATANAAAERFERQGFVKCFGILRCAQDDGKNKQMQEQ